MKVKAKDLQPGDRIISTPWRGSRDEGRTITEVNHKIQIRTDHPSAGSSLYAEDTDLLIERPTPTVTVELPLDVAKAYARQGQTLSNGRAVGEACRAALAVPPAEPALRVGAKVKRTGFTDPDVGRYGIGTVIEVRRDGRSAYVLGPNNIKAVWTAGNFEVVG